MADVTIDAADGGSTTRGPRCLVWTSATTGYFFFIDADSDFKYIKTTDRGATWSGLTTIFTGTAGAHDVWFDQWTPGISGTLIHTWYIESVTDDVFYRTLDTASDTLGTQRTVYAGTAVTVTTGLFVTGAKMRGGNLLCCFGFGNAGTPELGTYRSTDAGVNWGVRTNLVEAHLDRAIAFPGNETDTQDGWFLYLDVSADALTLKMHDDSANTNSESSTILTLVEGAAFDNYYGGFQGAVRLSDRHLIVAAWSEFDASTGDFRVFDINGTASITEKTALATNIDDCYYPVVYVDSSDKIHVAYIGKRDGSETLHTTAGVYYVTSTNGGTSWSAGDTAFSATASDWALTWAAPNGPRFAVAWWDKSSFALMTNSENSLPPFGSGARLTLLGVGA